MAVTVNVSATECAQTKDAQRILRRVSEIDAQIQSDIDALAGANTAQTKQIIGRMLTRQRRLIRVVAEMIADT